MSARAQLSPWVGLLYLLAEEARGLRNLRVSWWANPDDDFGNPQQIWDMGRGLGDSLLFVRALGKIRGLEELIIGGCYAKS